MKRTMIRSAAAIALLCLGASLGFSQNVTGSIAGVVRDPSGSVVPSITVHAINEGTGARFETTTDSDGQYTIRAVPIGVYSLTAEAQGFKRFETRGVRLQVNEVARVDINLAIGATTETVTVASEVVTVDTTTAVLKSVVDQKRIEDLPLNGRNPDTADAPDCRYRNRLARRHYFRNNLPWRPRRRLGEWQPRERRELHSRRRTEQRSLLQRAESDAESGRA